MDFEPASARVRKGCASGSNSVETLYLDEVRTPSQMGLNTVLTWFEPWQEYSGWTLKLHEDVIGTDSNFGITEPEEPITFPNLTIENLVNVSFL